MTSVQKALPQTEGHPLPRSSDRSKEPAISSPCRPAVSREQPLKPLGTSGLVLAGGRATVALLRFARNILLAHFISVADYGIASTFLVAMAFVELISDLALERMIVQDREGESPRFAAAIQGLQLVRGGLMAALFFALAGPAAELFGHPELEWAYQIFAVMPLIRSLAHIDAMRVQRDRRFEKLIASELVGAGGTLLLLWPVVLWLGDFRVMLCLLLLEFAGRTLVTHLLAERPFRIAWDGAVTVRALRFGLPLLASGALTFAVLQGDRILIANQFTAHDLGIYSAALTLAMTPALLAAGIAQSFFLPLLSRLQDDSVAFERLAVATLQVLLCAGCAGMLGFGLLGPMTFTLFFGERFAEGAPLVALIGIMFSLRLMRAAPTTIMLARARTMSTLIANLVRLVSLPVAVVVVLHGGTIHQILLIGVGSETLSLAISLFLLRSRLALPVPGRIGLPYALMLVLLVTLLSRMETATWDPVLDGAAILFFAAVVAACRDLRHRLAEPLRNLAARLPGRNTQEP